jgi:hypothetical protein
MEGLRSAPPARNAIIKTVILRGWKDTPDACFLGIFALHFDGDLCAHCCANCCACREQEYPSKLVRLIVPYAPDGGLDVVGRPIGLRGKLCPRAAVLRNSPRGCVRMSRKTRS